RVVMAWLNDLVRHRPGLLFVAATLLPLVSFVIVLLWLALRLLAKQLRQTTAGKAVYEALGGGTPGRAAGYVATAAIGLAFVCSFAGFVTFVAVRPGQEATVHRLEHEIRDLEEQVSHGRLDDDKKEAERKKKIQERIDDRKRQIKDVE